MESLIICKNKIRFTTVVVYGQLGTGQLAPGQLGTGQLGTRTTEHQDNYHQDPGAQLSWCPVVRCPIVLHSPRFPLRAGAFPHRIVAISNFAYFDAGLLHKLSICAQAYVTLHLSLVSLGINFPGLTFDYTPFTTKLRNWRYTFQTNPHTVLCNFPECVWFELGLVRLSVIVKIRITDISAYFEFS